MKVFIFAAFMVLACCAGCEAWNPYKIAEKNVNNSKQLRIGMTKAEVLAVMGEPLKNERFNRPDIWYYYYDCNWLDGLITEEECFPLVFKDSRLVGWGNRFYMKWQLENKDRIPVEKLPQEANYGGQK